MTQYHRALVREGAMVRPLNVGDGVVSNCNPSIQTGTKTLSIRELIGGAIYHTTTLGAAATYTLPTAAAIIATFSGMDIGDTYSFYVTNAQAAAFLVVIAVGAGITAQGANNSLSVVAQSTRMFTLKKTSATAMALY